MEELIKKLERMKDADFISGDIIPKILDVLRAPNGVTIPVYYRKWHYYECKFCGDEVKTTMNFCPDCGKKLDWDNEEWDTFFEEDDDYAFVQHD